MTINIALLGTCDTKLDELLLLRSKICNTGSRHGLNVKVILIDVGRSPVAHPDITVRQEEVAIGIELEGKSRNEVIENMIPAAQRIIESMLNRDPDQAIHGIIAAGGSTGTSLATAVMRNALPIGFPKLMVSTVASGDVGPLVGETDITMMYSVVDIAGCNSVLDEIFTNAASAITCMAEARRISLTSPAEAVKSERKRVGITMFGVTTPCVDIARQYLEDKHGYEVFVFHATGHGGIAMERLVREKRLDAVLDLTTSEICDHIAGGNMSAGPHRLTAPLQAGIPYVISLGALDMVNFGPRHTVPAEYHHRRLYEHNPVVTLMRTNEDECQRIANFINTKIKSLARDPTMVKVIIPHRGVSMLSTPGGPFENKAADGVLFSTIEQGLKASSVEIINQDSAINDEEFAIVAAQTLAWTLISA
ncbi:MAG: hypothetical protein M1831_001565 [Alyxoria varia]|nr:MAG: hypothetical protein M1831_001565 [Alyxoria varia]